MGFDGEQGKIVQWSNIARKQGLLGLESAVEGEKDEFLKKSLQSLVDGGTRRGPGGDMARVTGIGGVFFKARTDPAMLREWYQRHLGIKL